MTTTRPAWAYTLPAALLLMAPFDILASLAMDIYLPVVPAMPGILNTTPAMIQLTLSLYMVMLGVGQVIFGPLSDRIGRRPILLAGATAFVIASLGAAWSSTAPAFVAFRLLQAVGASAMLWRRSRRFATFMPTVLRVSSSTAFSVRCWRSCLRSALSPEH